MKAAAYDRYGPADVVQWREVAPPRPRGGELVVRVEAAALNPKDVVLRSGRFRVVSGNKFPKRLGLDLVGRVVDRGWRTPQAFANQRVFGFYSGLRALRGSLSELAVIPAGWVATISDRIDAATAAATPLAGSTALQALRDDAKLQAGEHVLIVGASGGVGTFAVQVAKLLGATVTGSTSARNAEFVRSLGADAVLDYASQAPLGEGPYDVVLDCFGKLRAREVARVLRRGGRYVSLVPSLEIFQDVARGLAFGPRTRMTSVAPRRRDLEQLARWLEEGRLRAEIDRVYEADQLHDAMRHLETRHARGKIVVRLGVDRIHSAGA